MGDDAIDKGIKMDSLYKSIVHGPEHFEILAPNTDIAETVVERLRPRLNLEGTYRMSGVLPKSLRHYHAPIENRPAVAVEITRMKGQGILFTFRQASDRFPQDIEDLAKILEIE